MTKQLDAVRAVSFDADGTLWDFEKVMRRSLGITLAELRRRLPGTGSNALTVEKMIEIRDGVAEELERKTANLETIRFEAFKSVVALVGGDPDGFLPRVLNELYMHHRFEDLELYPDVIPCLTALGKRYDLGLLTNGNGYPERCGLQGRFSFTAFAQDLGVAKPDVEFFRRALSLAGMEHHEVIHVGDSIRSDVAGANGAGCISVWLNRDGSANETGVIPDYEVASLAELPALLL